MLNLSGQILSHAWLAIAVSASVQAGLPTSETQNRPERGVRLSGALGIVDASSVPTPVKPRDKGPIVLVELLQPQAPGGEPESAFPPEHVPSVGDANGGPSLAPVEVPQAGEGVVESSEAAPRHAEPFRPPAACARCRLSSWEKGLRCIHPSHRRIPLRSPYEAGYPYYTQTSWQRWPTGLESSAIPLLPAEPIVVPNHE
jgi:hypothetical protein